MNCEYCNEEHDGSYGSGRFCNIKCARGFSSRDKRQEINDKVREKLKGRNDYIWNKGVITEVYCEVCGNIVDRRIRKDKKKTCSKCKRKVIHVKNNLEINDLLKLSKRTVQKILKRMELSCVICKWNESTCDIHHIEHKSNNGNDNLDNLIHICPNCHRIIHNIPDRYDVKILKSLSLINTTKDWREFYNKRGQMAE